MTVVLFIAVLFFLILVHELGHFLTAKWARMRVDEFAIGFPPRVLSLRRGETEYSINLLPIGGYVKIFGENGTDVADGPRAFGSRPRLHQAIVLLAGVAMNVLAAWAIFFAVALIGTPTIVDESPAAGATLTVINVVPDSPAAKAGIPLGSEITGATAEGFAISDLTPSALTEFVSAHPDDPIELTYIHKGAEGTATLLPTAGLIADDTGRKAVGLGTALVKVERDGPLAALLSATSRTYETLAAIVVGLSSFIASAFTLSADVSQVTGPIGIAGLVGEAAEFGLLSLLVFTAFISLNLAVINLLPIPALDGGRLIFVLIEVVIRRPINPDWMARVNLIGFAFLILLMVAVTYNDIIKIF